MNTLIDIAMLWLLLFPNAVCTFLVARWLWRKGMPAVEDGAAEWNRRARFATGHNGPPTHPRPAPPPCPPPRKY